jgi:hypothetical protein
MDIREKFMKELLAYVEIASVNQKQSHSEVSANRQLNNMQG